MRGALSLGIGLGHSRTAADASAASVIPVNAAGERPKYVAVTTSVAFGVWINFGDVIGMTADRAPGTGTSFLVPAHSCVVFRVDGNTHYAYEREGITDVIFSIYPLENEGGAAAAAGTP